MCTIVCLFVFFIFSHGVVSLFSIYEFDCHSGIFRPSIIRAYDICADFENFHSFICADFIFSFAPILFLLLIGFTGKLMPFCAINGHRRPHT